MNHEIAKNAIDLKVLPLVSVTDEEASKYPYDELVTKGIMQFRYNTDLSCEELLALTALKKYQTLTLIKNIMLGICAVVAVNAIAYIYFLTKLGKLLSLL